MPVLLPVYDLPWSYCCCFLKILHTNSILLVKQHQTLDTPIINKIFSVIGHTITNVNKVKNCVRELVENEISAAMLGEQSPSDLTDVSICSIGIAYSKDDQDSLRLKMEEWQRRNKNSHF